MIKRTAAIVLLLLSGAAVGVVPAHADPASAASATATGVQSVGLLTMPPSPTVTATQPPDSREQADASIDRVAGPITVKATSTVVAEAARESGIRTPVFSQLEDNARRRHSRVDTNNARAFSEARGVVMVLASEGGTPLVEATTVRATAVTRCEGNQAFFDTAFSVAGLKVLGREMSVDAIDLPIRPGSDPQLVISVKRGEAGRLPSGGIFMSGLHITIPALDFDVVLARSEARMPMPCGVPGSIVAEPTRLGTPVVAKRVVTPGTGGPSFLLPVGTGMVVLAGALRLITRRARPKAAGPPPR